jgi:hypothetical protein
VADRVICDTGSFPIVLVGWRVAVAKAFAAPHENTRIETASIECRSVVTGHRPVVIGSTAPSLMMLELTESQLRVEVSWRVRVGCSEERWEGRSTWRSVSENADASDGRAVAHEAQAALKEARADASMKQEEIFPCPSL